MATILKHVGKFGEKPCVVLFREVPNEPENCLIVLSASLNETEHDDLMSVVQSPEAQEAKEISTVLERRNFSSGESMLTSLHYSKKIQKVPVAQVKLTPTPSQDIPLADVNAEIRKIEGGYVPPKTEAEAETFQSPKPVELPQSNEPQSNEDIAQNMLMQADLMEEDGNRLIVEANLKREDAYKINPKLRKPGRPKKIDTEILDPSDD